MPSDHEPKIMKRSKWAVAFFILLFAAGGVVLSLQRQSIAKLRVEMKQLSVENKQVERLRIENQKLSAGQVSAIELDRMRDDHAALPRLRSEIQTLKRELASRAR